MKEDKDRDRSAGVSAIVWALLFLVGDVCALAGGFFLLYRRHSSVGTYPVLGVGWALSVLGLTAVHKLLGVLGEFHKKSTDIDEQLQRLKADWTKLSNFTRAFPVDHERVVAYLQAAACEVRKAYKAGADLYRGEASSVLIDDDESLDVGTAAGVLRSAFKRKEAEIDTALTDAFAEFRRRYDLVYNAGFTSLKSSWIDYDTDRPPGVGGIGTAQ